MHTAPHCSDTGMFKRLFKGHGWSHAPSRQTRHFIHFRNGIKEDPGSPIQVHSCKIDLLRLWCDDCSENKPEENLRMNSIKQPCKPFQRKDLAQSHPVCGCACLSTGGKEGIYSCCYCVSLAPNFIECSSWFAKVSQIPILELAIRTVWRKLCVLGIQRGLCCSSRNDARPWGRPQIHPVVTGGSTFPELNGYFY